MELLVGEESGKSITVGPQSGEPSTLRLKSGEIPINFILSMQQACCLPHGTCSESCQNCTGACNGTIVLIDVRCGCQPVAQHMRMQSHNLVCLMSNSMQRNREDGASHLKCMASLASQRWNFTGLQSCMCADTSHTLCFINKCNEHAWAARYNTWLLIKLTPKGVVFSFLFCNEHDFCVCFAQQAQRACRQAYKMWSSDASSVKQYEPAFRLNSSITGSPKYLLQANAVPQKNAS